MGTVFLYHKVIRIVREKKSIQYHYFKFCTSIKTLLSPFIHSPSSKRKLPNEWTQCLPYCGFFSKCLLLLPFIRS